MDTTVNIIDYFKTYFLEFLDTAGEALDTTKPADQLVEQALEELRMRNLGAAQSYLQQAAELGHAQAAYGFALCHAATSQSDLPTTLAEVAEWLAYAADMGAVQAMLLSAFLHLDAELPLYNLQQSTDWFRRAAEAGNAEGCYEYGCSLMSGRGVPQDFSASLFWLQKAAERGDTLAQFELGVQYACGEGVEPDQAKAFALFEQAAAAEHPGAMAALAQYYYNGEQVEQDFGKAWSLNFRCYLAGNPKGNLGLAHFYLDNTAIASDYQTALQLLSTEEAATFPPAVRLKEDLLNGLLEAVKKQQPPAYTQLGWAMLNGYAYDCDPEQAYTLISTAAQMDDPLARCLLRCYLPDRNSPLAYSTEQCAAFFREQAGYGQAWAARELLQMLNRGDITATDDELAEVIHAAIELGDFWTREMCHHLREAGNQED